MRPGPEKTSSEDPNRPYFALRVNENSSDVIMVIFFFLD